MSAKLKAFDLATEVTKQLMALSSGILAITIALAKSTTSNNSSHLAKALLASAWIMFLVSIICGILVLQFFAGKLHDAEDNTTPSFAGKEACLAAAQAITFGLALVVVVVFAIWNLFV